MHDASLWALCLPDIAKAFGGRMAVDGVSLPVKPDERRALLGPNSVGKTVLLHLISGE
jgi:ABC-2 type transport system ATP-binding protein